MEEKTTIQVSKKTNKRVMLKAVEMGMTKEELINYLLDKEGA